MELVFKNKYTSARKRKERSRRMINLNEIECENKDDAHIGTAPDWVFDNFFSALFANGINTWNIFAIR